MRRWRRWEHVGGCECENCSVKCTRSSFWVCDQCQLAQTGSGWGSYRIASWQICSIYFSGYSICLLLTQPVSQPRNFKARCMTMFDFRAKICLMSAYSLAYGCTAIRNPHTLTMWYLGSSPADVNFLVVCVMNSFFVFFPRVNTELTSHFYTHRRAFVGGPENPNLVQGIVQSLIGCSASRDSEDN